MFIHNLLDVIRDIEGDNDGDGAGRGGFNDGGGGPGPDGDDVGPGLGGGGVGDGGPGLGEGILGGAPDFEGLLGGAEGEGGNAEEGGDIEIGIIPSDDQLVRYLNRKILDPHYAHHMIIDREGEYITNPEETNPGCYFTRITKHRAKRVYPAGQWVQSGVCQVGNLVPHLTYEKRILWFYKGPGPGRASRLLTRYAIEEFLIPQYVGMDEFFQFVVLRFYYDGRQGAEGGGEQGGGREERGGGGADEQGGGGPEDQGVDHEIQGYLNDGFEEDQFVSMSDLFGAAEGGSGGEGAGAGAGYC